MCSLLPALAMFAAAETQKNSLLVWNIHQSRYWFPTRGCQQSQGGDLTVLDRTDRKFCILEIPFMLYPSSNTLRVIGTSRPLSAACCLTACCWICSEARRWEEIPLIGCLVNRIGAWEVQRKKEKSERGKTLEPAAVISVSLQLICPIKIRKSKKKLTHLALRGQKLRIQNVNKALTSLLSRDR